MLRSDQNNSYSKDSIEHVKNLKDEDLRNMLLHTIRQLENITNDRDSFEKENNRLVVVIKRLRKYGNIEFNNKAENEN